MESRRGVKRGKRLAWCGWCGESLPSPRSSNAPKGYCSWACGTEDATDIARQVVPLPPPVLRPRKGLISLKAALAYMAAHWPTTQVGPGLYRVNGHELTAEQMVVRLNRLRESKNEQPVRLLG